MSVLCLKVFVDQHRVAEWLKVYFSPLSICPRHDLYYMDDLVGSDWRMCFPCVFFILFKVVVEHTQSVFQAIRTFRIHRRRYPLELIKIKKQTITFFPGQGRGDGTRKRFRSLIPLILFCVLYLLLVLFLFLLLYHVLPCDTVWF